MSQFFGIHINAPHRRHTYGQSELNKKLDSVLRLHVVFSAGGAGPGRGGAYPVVQRAGQPGRGGRQRQPAHLPRGQLHRLRAGGQALRTHPAHLLRHRR